MDIRNNPFERLMGGVIMDEQKEPARASATRPQEERGRLEDLLFQDSPAASGTTREIRVVGARKRFWRWSVVSLLLLLGGLALLYALLEHLPTRSPEIPVVQTGPVKRLPMPPRPPADAPSGRTASGVTGSSPDSGTERQQAEPASVSAEAGELPTGNYRLVIGPLILEKELRRATRLLDDLGLPTEKRPGQGQVGMIRLLAGEYPPGEAAARLEELKKLAPGAFLLPDNERRALYAGSFHDPREAAKVRADLRAQGIALETVEVEVPMNGTLLVTRIETDRQTAEQLVRRLAGEGLRVRSQRQETAAQ